MLLGTRFARWLAYNEDFYLPKWMRPKTFAKFAIVLMVAHLVWPLTWLAMRHLHDHEIDFMELRYRVRRHEKTRSG
jgi:hypothetical protein